MCESQWIQTRVCESQITTHQHAVEHDGDAAAVEGVQHELAVQVLVPDPPHTTHQHTQVGHSVSGATGLHARMLRRMSPSECSISTGRSLCARTHGHVQQASLVNLCMHEDVCNHASLYVCVYACMHASMYVYMYACMAVCEYVCKHVPRVLRVYRHGCVAQHGLQTRGGHHDLLVQALHLSQRSVGKKAEMRK
jgi:hypothetical protein